MAPPDLPPAVRLALTVLLNHVEPGWDNCRAVVRAWMEGELEANGETAVALLKNDGPRIVTDPVTHARRVTAPVSGWPHCEWLPLRTSLEEPATVWGDVVCCPICGTEYNLCWRSREERAATIVQFYGDCGSKWELWVQPCTYGQIVLLTRVLEPCGE